MDFNYAVITNKGFEEAITDIKQALAQEKFGVLWELDVPSKLKEKGVNFTGQARILEVCNPHKAKEVLEQNINVIYFLPCKVVIYDDEGQVKIGMIRPTALMEVLQDDILKTFAEEVENSMKQALDSAK